MNKLVLIWSLLCFVVLFAIALALQPACVLQHDADFSASNPQIGTVVFEDHFTPQLRVQLLRSDDRENTPRIVLGKAFECLTTYGISNPSNRTLPLQSLILSVKPHTAFEAVTVEWADEKRGAPILAQPERDNLLRITFPGNGDEVKAKTARTIRICGVIKHVTATESGVDVSATIVAAQQHGGTLAAIVNEKGYTQPNHILRVSHPTVTIMTSPSRALRIGRQDLLSWSVGADPLGMIAIKQFAFHLDVMGVTFCDVKLLREGKLAGTHAYEFRAIAEDRRSSQSVRGECLNTSLDLAAIFHEEHVIAAGKRSTFILRANVISVAEKAKLAIRFLHSNDRLTDTLGCGSHGFATFSSNSKKLPGLLWSDISHLPHRHAPCGSSRDWTTDALVRNLERVQSFDASL